MGSGVFGFHVDRDALVRGASGQLGLVDSGVEVLPARTVGSCDLTVGPVREVEHPVPAKATTLADFGTMFPDRDVPQTAWAAFAILPRRDTRMQGKVVRVAVGDTRLFARFGLNSMAGTAEAAEYFGKQGFHGYVVFLLVCSQPQERCFSSTVS